MKAPTIQASKSTEAETAVSTHGKAFQDQRTPMPVFPTLKTHKETKNRIILQEIPTTSGDLASQFAETAPELRNNSKILMGTLESRDSRKKPSNSTRRHEIDQASEWGLQGDEGLPWKDCRRDTLIHDEGVGILGHGRGRFNPG